MINQPPHKHGQARLFAHFFRPISAWPNSDRQKEKNWFILKIFWPIFERDYFILNRLKESILTKRNMILDLSVEYF